MDTIADFLTVVRNAGAAQHKTATVPYSKIKESIARIMKDEGSILDYVVEGDKIKNLTLTLKYQNRKHVIQALRRISKPGIRCYVPVKSIPRVLGGLGIVILSTPKGVMTGVEARKNNCGGEVLCYIW